MIDTYYIWEISKSMPDFFNYSEPKQQSLSQNRVFHLIYIANGILRKWVSQKEECYETYLGWLQLVTL